MRFSSLYRRIPNTLLYVDRKEWSKSHFILAAANCVVVLFLRCYIPSIGFSKVILGTVQSLKGFESYQTVLYCGAVCFSVKYDLKFLSVDQTMLWGLWKASVLFGASQTNLQLFAINGTQETVLLVIEVLETSGFKVRMDLEQMKGSIFEAMARAVEQTSVLLLAISQISEQSKHKIG